VKEEERREKKEERTKAEEGPQGFLSSFFGFLS
jgi:hypothetical protein